ncbi:MAG: succinate dehydrogenase, hydrophobic membrane anchor protein [Mariprofundaceae bacterium]|nr:succinate dehydrogenase, hydrophobic membrane anchor protein [Mariprofundaceae bacterium]
MVNQHRDLGSAHSGFSDWYWQRFSAVVLATLLPAAFVLLWAVYSGVLDQQSLLDYLDSFVSRLLHSLLIVALMVHAYMGLKVMIEDYVHAAMRIFLIALMLVMMGLFGMWWLALIWAWGG